MQHLISNAIRRLTGGAPTRVADDRGRAVPLYLGSQHPWANDQFPKAEFDRFIRRIHRCADRGFCPHQFALAGLILFAASQALLLFMQVQAYGFTSGALWPAAGLALGMLSSAFARQRMPAADADRIRDILLDHARCPSCAYALRGVPESDDGCRVCPECAAAWRIEAPSKTADRNGSPLLEGEG